MIKNDRQRALTEKQIKIFGESLAEFVAAHGSQPADPLKRAQKEALESQLADLQEELHDYEALVAGGPKVGKKRPLAELSQALIEARIASELTQRQLAERLEMKEQQVQRYEANDYASASLGRILDVAEAFDSFTFTFQLDRRSPSSLGLPVQANPANPPSDQGSIWWFPPLAAMANDPNILGYANLTPYISNVGLTPYISMVGARDRFARRYLDFDWATELPTTVIRFNTGQVPTPLAVRYHGAVAMEPTEVGEMRSLIRVLGRSMTQGGAPTRAPELGASLQPSA
jgi:transcriptional regulator with XRE-family HTH domain